MIRIYSTKYSNNDYILKENSSSLHSALKFKIYIIQDSQDIWTSLKSIFLTQGDMISLLYLGLQVFRTNPLKSSKICGLFWVSEYKC